MSHYYRNSPVSGFTGHVPGARFTVGRRALKTPGREDRERVQRERSEAASKTASNGRTSISSEELIPIKQSQSDFGLHQTAHSPVPHLSEYAHVMNGSFQQPGFNNGVINGGGGVYDPRLMASNGYQTMATSYGNIPQAFNDSMNYTMGYNSQGYPIRVPRDGGEMSEYHYYRDGVGGGGGGVVNGAGGGGGGGGGFTDDRGIRYGDVGEHFSSTMARGQLDESSGGGANRSGRAASSTETKRRSQSMPRRRLQDGVPMGKDPFEGLDGGLYSKGEVLRNKERRLLAMRGEPVMGRMSDFRTSNYGTAGGGVGGGGGNGYGGVGSELDDSPLTEEERARRKEVMEEENDRIPAAGYSGHIPRMRRVGVGKSFNSAAREAKKEFIEDKAARSTDGSDFDLSRSSRAKMAEGKFDAASGRVVEHLNHDSRPQPQPPSSVAPPSSLPPLYPQPPLQLPPGMMFSPTGPLPQSMMGSGIAMAPNGSYVDAGRYGPGIVMNTGPYAPPSTMMSPSGYYVTYPASLPPSSFGPGTTANGGVGGNFGSGLAQPADRTRDRDDASSIEQLGAGVGKVVVSQDGLFANSLIRRADGSFIDITPPGIIKDEPHSEDQQHKEDTSPGGTRQSMARTTATSYPLSSAGYLPYPMYSMAGQQYPPPGTVWSGPAPQGPTGGGGPSDRSSQRKTVTYDAQTVFGQPITKSMNM